MGSHPCPTITQEITLGHGQVTKFLRLLFVCVSDFMVPHWGFNGILNSRF